MGQEPAGVVQRTKYFENSIAVCREDPPLYSVESPVEGVDGETRNTGIGLRFL